MPADPSGKKSRPRTKVTPGVRRALQQRRGIGAVGQVEPDEVAALGLAPARSGPAEPGPKGAEHRVAARPQKTDDPGQVRLVGAARDQLVDGGLRQKRWRDVRRDGALLEACRHLLGQHEPADADTGGDGLREGGGVRDEPPSFELVQARRRLALVADEAVRVVLEQRQVVGLRELDDAASAFQRERPAARVLERRDRVEERDVAAPAELPLERVGVEALVVHRQRDHLGAFPREDLQRPVVGRALDEHTTGPARELLGRVEDEALQPARRDRHPAGATPWRSPSSSRSGP